ncbi:MAG: CotH kinase family protein [Defluviitaleaceae bacterium]|nr:CotH kinase family protein [Defluviitaleaceae bacterium]
MEKMRIVLPIAIVVILIGSIFLFDGSNQRGISLTNALEFSAKEHFYSEDFFVEITSSTANVNIFYTLDGSTPSPRSNLYTDPLRFNAREDLQVVTLRAATFYNENAVSHTLTHTYFVGTGVNERFDTIIFSLTTDSENLFDFETGIMVPGKIRADFERDEGREGSAGDPANFSMSGEEWERPVNVETFLPSGTRVISQVAGMRTHSTWNHESQQHALRLIARRELDPNDANRFGFNFFGETAQDGYGTPIARYNTLILRNGGNDRYHSMLRNEVGFALAKSAGLNTVSPFRPAAVFLNGEYYGFSWLQVRNTDHFLEALFGSPTREFDNVSGGETEFDTEDINVLLDLYDLMEFANRDLTDDAIFSQLEAILDVEDFLRYYAFQMYMGAEDWPHDNIRRFRYTGEQVPGLVPELDGRWRHVVTNLDRTLGLFDGRSAHNNPTFQQMLTGENPRSPILVSILKRKDMQEMFAMIVNDLASNVVTERNIRRTIRSLVTDASNEINFAIAAGNFSDDFSWETAEEQHEHMERFGDRRDRTVFPFLAEHFGFKNELFTVRVTGGDAYIGTVPANSAQYFSHLTVPLRPFLSDSFTTFESWLVNGAFITTPTITVSAADAIDGVVEVHLVTRTDYPQLVIRAAHETPEESAIFLRNPSNEDIFVEGLFLSNDSERLQRFRIPRLLVPANDTLELAGENCPSVEGTPRVRLNFNIRTGRMIFLSDENGNVLQTFVPN